MKRRQGRGQKLNGTMPEFGGTWRYVYVLVDMCMWMRGRPSDIHLCSCREDAKQSGSRTGT